VKSKEYDDDYIDQLSTSSSIDDNSRIRVIPYDGVSVQKIGKAFLN